MTMTARERIIADLADPQPQPVKRPKKIPIGQLHEEQDVFQGRSVGGSLAHFNSKVKELKAVEDSGVVLLPITVWWTGARWVVLDGHHRMELYRQKGRTKVDVAAFQGTLEEAEEESRRVNAMVQNYMSPPEKAESAWKLVLADPTRDRTKTAQSAGVSRKTVQRMVLAYKLLSSHGWKATDMRDLGWTHCRTNAESIKEEGATGTERDDAAYQKHLEDTADRFFKALGKEFAGNWGRYAEALAFGLSKNHKAFAKALIESYHLSDLVETQGVLYAQERVEEEAVEDEISHRNSARVNPDDPF